MTSSRNYFQVIALMAICLTWAELLYAGDAKTADGQTIATYSTTPSTFIALGDVNTGDGTVSDIRFRSAGVDYMWLGPYVNDPALIRLNLNGDYALKGQSIIQLSSGVLSLGDIHGGDGLIDAISLRTKDQPRLYINSTGMIGVGHTDPNYDLDVRSGGAVNIRGATGKMYVCNVRPNTGRAIQFGLDQTPPATEEQFRINVDGLVSVKGQAAIQYDAGGQSMYLGDIMSGDGIFPNLVLKTNDQNRVWVDGNGNMGIGAPSTGSKLEVSGRIRSSGGAIISGQATQPTLFLSGGPSIPFASLRDKWNLPTTNSNNASLPFITPNGNNASGFGFLEGDNVSSPTVWMYEYGGRNAFTVARKGYQNGGDNPSSIDNALTPLFQVRENGQVGIGTTNPLATLDVRGNAKVSGTLVVDAGITTKTWTVAPDYVFEKDYKLKSLEEVDSFVQKHKHLPEVPSAKEFKEKGMDLAEMNFTLLKKVEELTLHAIRMEKEMKRQAEELRRIKEKSR